MAEILKRVSGLVEATNLIYESVSNLSSLGTPPSGVLGVLKGGHFAPGQLSRNGRYYPVALWENLSKNSELNETIKSNRLLGTIGHDLMPDNNTLGQGLFSHYTKNINWKTGYGESYIIPTPAGKILSVYADAGVKLYFSSFGRSRYLPNQMHEGYPIVDPDNYFLDKIDVVLDGGFVLDTQYQKLYENTFQEELKSNECLPIIKESMNTSKIFFIKDTISDKKENIGEASYLLGDVEGKDKIETEDGVEASYLLDKEQSKTISLPSSEVNKETEEEIKQKFMLRSADTVDLSMEEMMSNDIILKEDFTKLTEKVDVMKQIVEDLKKSETAAVAMLEEFKAIGELNVFKEYNELGSVEDFKAYKELGTVAEIKKLSELSEAHFTELQKYRALGSVEKFQKLKEEDEFEPDYDEKEINPGMSDEEELDAYRAIGSLEEVEKLQDLTAELVTAIKDENDQEKAQELADELAVDSDIVASMISQDVEEALIRKFAESLKKKNANKKPTATARYMREIKEEKTRNVPEKKKESEKRRILSESFTKVIL